MARIFIAILIVNVFVVFTSAQYSSKNVTAIEKQFVVINKIFNLFNNLKYNKIDLKFDNKTRNDATNIKNNNLYDDLLCAKQLAWFQEKLNENDIGALYCELLEN